MRGDFRVLVILPTSLSISESTRSGILLPGMLVPSIRVEARCKCLSTCTGVYILLLAATGGRGQWAGSLHLAWHLQRPQPLCVGRVLSTPDLWGTGEGRRGEILEGKKYRLSQVKCLQLAVTFGFSQKM